MRRALVRAPFITWAGQCNFSSTLASLWFRSAPCCSKYIGSPLRPHSQSPRCRRLRHRRVPWLRVRMRSSVRFIRRNWSRHSRRRPPQTTPRRRPRPPRRLQWKRRVPPRGLMIQASPQVPHCQTSHRLRRHTQHRRSRISLRRRRRTIAVTCRLAGVPISRSALLIALISRSMVHAACAVRRPSGVPTVSKETNRSVDPGVGATIRRKWTAEHGGASMTKMTKMRTTWSCSEEAAAGNTRAF